MARYNIYTDGSSRGNPGPGGWGAVVLNEEENSIVTTESGSEPHTTNNRMELKAILFALNWAESNPQDTVHIYSDSAYAVNACNDWIFSWARNGWVNSKKKTVENLELMQGIYTHLKRPYPNFRIERCPGHAGLVGNELADALATGSRAKFKELAEYYFDIEIADFD